MAKQTAKAVNEKKKSLVNAEKILKRQFRFLKLIAIVLFVLVLGANIAAFTRVIGADRPREEWLLSATLSSALIILFGVISFIAISAIQARVQKQTGQAIEQELGQLRAATKRAESLQAMAATMRATLNFQRVVDSAIDVCAVAIEEIGVPETALVAGVFLYDDNQLLRPVSSRRLGGRDDQAVPGQAGIIAEALNYAEPAVSKDPRKDPELYEYPGFRKCKSAVAVPLRVGFQMFGVLIVASEVQIDFDKDQLALFSSVGDQAVISLRNAQLYENLEKEKQRLLEAEREARNQLARDLHDGPTQSIAAIAMRINFVRTLLAHEPDQALDELAKVEELAKDTGKNIRGMLFTLRPLILETEGLGAAIKTVMERIEETDGIQMRLIGSEYGELLNQRAQGVLFYMIEEALGNAKKHSRANIMEVRFWQEGNLFVARIQDDGVGFDVDEVMSDYSSRGSLGMINLQERAESIDGSVKVESQVGKGTAITVVVPLEKQGATKAKR